MIETHVLIFKILGKNKKYLPYDCQLKYLLDPQKNKLYNLSYDFHRHQ
jgi:hypothetical protein